MHTPHATYRATTQARPVFTTPVNYTALPLPTGRYVVADINTATGDVTFYSGAGLNGQLGRAPFRGVEQLATLFYTPRDAENCARALNRERE